MNHLFGRSLDKNLQDFEVIAQNFEASNQRSRAKAIRYLMERCRLAEEKIEIWSSASEE